MQTKNKFFLANGILSIISAVGCFFSSITSFVLGIKMKNGTNELIKFFFPDSAFTEEEIQQILEAFKLYSPYIIAAGIFLIVDLAIMIYCAVAYFKLKNKTYDELHSMSGYVVTTIVFSFVGGGILIGILGLCGYYFKPQPVTAYAPQPENYTPSSTASSALNNQYHDQTTMSLNSIQESLKVLKSMHDDGLIDDETYNKKRAEILKNL